MRVLLVSVGFCTSLTSCLPWPELVPAESKQEEEPCEPRMLVHPRPGYYTLGNPSLMPGKATCTSVTPWGWGIYQAQVAAPSESAAAGALEGHEVDVRVRKMDPSLAVAVDLPYAMLVGSRPPSCFLWEEFAGTEPSAEIKGSHEILTGVMVKDEGAETFTRVKLPVWPDKAAFDQAPENEVKYVFVMTDGDPGDEPEEQIRWWQPYPLIFRKACAEAQPAARALFPLDGACSECTALAVDRAGYVVVGGARQSNAGARQGKAYFSIVARFDPESYQPNVPLDEGAPPPWVSRSSIPLTNPRVEAVGTDRNANVFFGGAAAGDVAFDDQMSTSGGYNGFIGKLQTLSGGVDWIRYVEGKPWSSDEERVLSLAVSAGGEVFVAGAFTYEVSLGLGCQLPSLTGPKFLAKLSAEGHCQWIRPLIGVTDAVRLSVIGETRVLLAFGFEGQVIYDEWALTDFDQRGAAWVVLDGADGLPAMSQSADLQMGTLLSDAMGNLQLKRALAHDGGILLTGSFSGLILSGGASVDAGADRGGFVASFSAGGDFGWFLPVGETGDDVVAGIATDSTGDIVLGGSVSGEGTLHVGGVPLTRRGARDILVAKWRPRPGGGSPAVVWAGLWGEDGDDTISSLTVDGAGHVWVLGNTTGTVRAAGSQVESQPFLLQIYP